MTRLLGAEAKVGVAELDDGLGALRLCDAGEVGLMRQSLERYGQLQPIVAFRDEGQLRVLDGLKRLRAARGMGWTELHTSIAETSAVDAKAWLFEVHRHQGLCELEEAWLVRSLQREDGLTQGAIAHCLGRHKSWVSRRLVLVEGLDEAVQADVRLGLLAPRAAVALSPLPRGNARQNCAAAVIVRRGMTVRQTERMVAELSSSQDSEEWSRCLTRFSETGGNATEASPEKPPTPRSDAEAIRSDVATLLRASVRLQVRLCQAPLNDSEAERSRTLRQALEELLSMLDALSLTLSAITRGAGHVTPREAMCTH